jgi:hypothetical protein
MTIQKDIEMWIDEEQDMWSGLEELNWIPYITISGRVVFIARPRQYNFIAKPRQYNFIAQPRQQ